MLVTADHWFRVGEIPINGIVGIIRMFVQLRLNLLVGLRGFSRF